MEFQVIGYDWLFTVPKWFLGQVILCSITKYLTECVLLVEEKGRTISTFL